MKKVFLMAAMLLALAACTSNGDQNNQNVNENMDKKEKPQAVEGRKNFGADHALITTPQPCVMIATWDKDHNPDVMMAAWAGQLDYKQIVIVKILLDQILDFRFLRHGKNQVPVASFNHYFTCAVCVARVGKEDESEQLILSVGTFCRLNFYPLFRAGSLPGTVAVHFGFNRLAVTSIKQSRRIIFYQFQNNIIAGGLAGAQRKGRTYHRRKV